MHARACVVVLQAFAWFSDLLVEHAEIFWSLFAVDMDAVLEMQALDTWDSFPLFQLLNDYLRSDGEEGGGRGGEREGGKGGREGGREIGEGGERGRGDAGVGHVG